VQLIEIEIELRCAARARAPDKPRVYLGSSQAGRRAGVAGVAGSAALTKEVKRFTKMTNERPKRKKRLLLLLSLSLLHRVPQRSIEGFLFRTFIFSHEKLGKKDGKKEEEGVFTFTFFNNNNYTYICTVKHIKMGETFIIS